MTSTLPSEPVPLFSLTPELRQRLAALADILITGGEGFPTPSEVSIETTWIDDAIAAMPSMGAVVRTVVEMTGEPADLMATLQADQPELFFGFALIVSGAYLMHPDVRSLLGYAGRAPQENPPLDGEWEYFLEDGILDAVTARGQIWRDVPQEAP